MNSNQDNKLWNCTPCSRKMTLVKPNPYPILYSGQPKQFTFSALDFTCSVTRVLPTFDVNKPRKFGHPVLKQPLHVYKLRVAISSSRVYIIFPLLKVLETRIVPGSKCQNRRTRATSTLWMWQEHRLSVERIFWNFAIGNRLCSRKNGFASGSKLRKRSN